MARSELPAALAPLVRALWAARTSVAAAEPEDPVVGVSDGRVSPADGSLPASGFSPGGPALSGGSLPASGVRPPGGPGPGGSWPAGRSRPTDGPGRPTGDRSAGLVHRCEEFVRGHRSVLRQQSGTTCGPNALAMFRVLTDPAFLPRALTTRDTGGWGALEGRLQAAMNSGAGTPPWPTAWGTLPWALAHHLRTLPPPGLEWRVRRADPHAPGQVRHLLDAAGGWCTAGLPVPVYVGNDRLPRHVVLLLSVTPETLTLYDPALGALSRAPTGELIDGRRPVAGWRRVWCVLVPS